MAEGGLIVAIIDVLAIGVAVLIVLAAVRLGSLQFALIAPHDAEAVPLLHSLGFATGLAAAAALLLTAPHAAEFSPQRLFAPQSSWDVTLGGFLSLYALPARATLVAAWKGLGGVGGSAGMAAGWVAVLAAVAGLAVSFRMWRGRLRWRAALSFLVLAGWTALITNYAAHLAAWGLMQLSFWAFLLALLAFQRWRYRPQATSHA
jgi:hypothetical protein